MHFSKFAFSYTKLTKTQLIIYSAIHTLKIDNLLTDIFIWLRTLDKRYKTAKFALIKNSSHIYFTYFFRLINEFIGISNRLSVLSTFHLISIFKVLDIIVWKTNNFRSRLRSFFKLKSRFYEKTYSALLLKIIIFIGYFLKIETKNRKMKTTQEIKISY